MRHCLVNGQVEVDDFFVAFTVDVLPDQKTLHHVSGICHLSLCYNQHVVFQVKSQDFFDRKPTLLVLERLELDMIIDKVDLDESIPVRVAWSSFLKEDGIDIVLGVHLDYRMDVLLELRLLLELEVVLLVIIAVELDYTVLVESAVEGKQEDFFGLLALLVFDDLADTVLQD